MNPRSSCHHLQLIGTFICRRGNGANQREGKGGRDEKQNQDDIIGPLEPAEIKPGKLHFTVTVANIFPFLLELTLVGSFGAKKILT